MIDFLAKRDIMETIIPSDAASPSINAGVAGAWSTYRILITAAGLTYPFILCGAYVMEAFQLTNQGTQSGMLNIEVAKGAAGFEVPVAESHGGLLLSPGGVAQTVTGITGRTHFFEPVLIPAGNRLAYRASTTAAATMMTSVYLFGYDARYFAQPLEYIKELRYIRGLSSPTQGATVYPSPGATAVQTNAAAWVYGAPVQFIAAAASPLLITGLFGSATAIFNVIQAQIGIGAGGSEQWMSKVGLPLQLGFPGPFCDCYLPRPLFVKSGERVSVQIAGGWGNTATNIALKGFALK